jgi:hypothetical protein
MNYAHCGDASFSAEAALHSGRGHRGPASATRRRLPVIACVRDSTTPRRRVLCSRLDTVSPSLPRAPAFDSMSSRCRVKHCLRWSADGWRHRVQMRGGETKGGIEKDLRPRRIVEKILCSLGFGAFPNGLGVGCPVELSPAPLPHTCETPCRMCRAPTEPRCLSRRALFQFAEEQARLDSICC